MGFDHERLGIADAARETRIKYAWKTYVAPQDRVSPVDPAAPAPSAPPPVEPPKPHKIYVPSRLSLTGRGGGYGGATKYVANPDLAASRVRDIIEIVCDVFGVSVESVLSASRYRKVARARQAAMALMESRMRLSRPSIGKIMQRDHTTTTYAIAGMVPRLIETDPSFANLYRHAGDLIRQKWAVQ